MQISQRSASLALVVLAAVAAGAGPARAGRSPAAEAGLGVGAVFGNVLYMPVKVMYAAFGGLIGGIAYGLSAGDEDVAMRIIEPAWRGDYALLPAHLTGEEDLEFIGRRGSHRAAREAEPGDVGSGGGRSGWE
jgi:hypothetical protein